MKSEANSKFGICTAMNSCPAIFPEAEVRRTLSGKVVLTHILRGDAVVEIDEISYQLHADTMVYMNPNHLVQMISRSDDLLFEYLWFDFDFLSDFPLLLKADVSDYVGKNPCLKLRGNEPTWVRKYYDLIIDRYNEAGDGDTVIKGLLFSLVLEVSRLFSGRAVSVSSSRQDELTDRFFALLHQHYGEQRSASFYADKMCISDKYLMRVLKNVTGQTFHYWVTDFVMREAKLLLRSTTMSVTAISERLNFPNPSFFARIFRQYVGVSPGEFRGW